MKPHQFTRRELLAGVAGATGLGAAAGTGTAALVSDRSVFDSQLTTGSLDLRVDRVTGETTGSSQGTVAVPVELTAEDPTQVVDLTVSLPDGGDANPAFAWVRSRCPQDGDLASKLDVTLRYASCDADCILYSGPLSGLAAGVPIDASGDASVDPGQQQCLQPGRDIDLQLVVSISAFRGRGSASFTLDFVGTQCRHASGVTSPFQGETDCEEDSDGGQHAISYVAFCTTGDEPADPDVTVLETNDDGEPVSVAWTTAVDVIFVCVKAANSLTVYDYSDESRTSGTATVGDDAAAIPAIELAPGEASTPCDVAARELGWTGDVSDLTSTKLEYEDVNWEGEDE